MCDFCDKVTDLYWISQIFRLPFAPKHNFSVGNSAPKHDFSVGKSAPKHDFINFRKKGKLSVLYKHGAKRHVFLAYFSDFRYGFWELFVSLSPDCKEFSFDEFMMSQGDVYCVFCVTSCYITHEYSESSRRRLLKLSKSFWRSFFVNSDNLCSLGNRLYLCARYDRKHIES